MNHDFISPAKNKIQHLLSGCSKTPYRRFWFYILLSLLINIVFVFVYSCVSTIDFCINDDYFINLFLAGGFGEPTGFGVYINIILGKIISWLYTVIPSINWYGIIMLVILMSSFTIIDAILLDKFGKKWGLLLVLLVTSIFGCVFLSNFTYTMIAYACVTVSCISFFYGFFTDDKKKRITCYVFGVLYALIVALIRTSVLATLALILIGFSLTILVIHKKKALKSVILIALSLLLCMGAVFVNHAFCNSDEELKEYTAFNKVRTEFADFGLIHYNDYREAYDEAKWSSNDYIMYNLFMYPEGRQYTTENLKIITDARAPNKYSADPYTAFLQLAGGLRTPETVYAILFMLIAFILVMFMNRQKFLAIALVCMPFLFHLLFVLMKRPEFRVVYPHYFIAAVLLLVLINPRHLSTSLAHLKECAPRAYRAFTAIALTVGCLFLFLNLSAASSYNATKINRTTQSDIATDIAIHEYVQKHPENVYMGPSGVLVDHSILYVPEPNSWTNYILTGGWYSRSPYYNDQKEKYGIYNIYDDLILNDHYYIIAPPNIDAIKNYFFQNHGIGVDFECVDEVCGAKVYRLIEVPTPN
ncbi:MAG: hypothetical protein RR954_04510 [Christensenellaceae bacterium]